MAWLQDRSNAFGLYVITSMARGLDVCYDDDPVITIEPCTSFSRPLLCQMLLCFPVTSSSFPVAGLFVACALTYRILPANIVSLNRTIKPVSFVPGHTSLNDSTLQWDKGVLYDAVRVDVLSQISITGRPFCRACDF
jgi:hypothetical protein